MRIVSWWRRFRQREDEEAIERAQERVHESLDERRIASGDVQGLQADEMAARSVHEANVDDAERFAKDDDGP
jgi:hypothetical protein